MRNFRLFFKTRVGRKPQSELGAEKIADGSVAAAAPPKPAAAGPAVVSPAGSSDFTTAIQPTQVAGVN